MAARQKGARSSGTVLDVGRVPKAVCADHPSIPLVAWSANQKTTPSDANALRIPNVPATSTSTTQQQQHRVYIRAFT